MVVKKPDPGVGDTAPCEDWFWDGVTSWQGTDDNSFIIVRVGVASYRVGCDVVIGEVLK